MHKVKGDIKVSCERWGELSKLKVACYIMVPMNQAVPDSGAAEQWACMFKPSEK